MKKIKIKITTPSNVKNEETLERIVQKRQVAEIYSELIKLLSEYSSSHGYTIAPDGSDSLVYYRNKMDEIEVKINQIYDNIALVKLLMFIIRPLKQEICQCSLVLKPWFSVNPNLRFYAAPFNLMMDSPKLYKSIIKGESVFTLDFYPDWEDLVEYHKYFNKINSENKKYNYHYTEDELFQRELIQAAKTFFNDFVYRLISK